MTKMLRRLLAFALLSALLLTQSVAQTPKPDPKPYSLLTNGRQLTIKSGKGIKHVMVWTADGNRVVEQKDINNSSCVVDIPVRQKIFYVMIGLGNGQVFTEKVGVN